MTFFYIYIYIYPIQRHSSEFGAPTWKYLNMFFDVVFYRTRINNMEHAGWLYNCNQPFINAYIQHDYISLSVCAFCLIHQCGEHFYAHALMRVVRWWRWRRPSFYECAWSVMWRHGGGPIQGHIFFLFN